MSIRRCIPRASSWARLTLRSTARRSPSCGVAVGSPVLQLTPLERVRLTQLRFNHDETDNLGTQVTIDITNRRRTNDDDDDDDDDAAAANIYVTSFLSTGFKLSNTYSIVGPCILFPRTILSWNVASARDITPESLTVFSLLEPRLDVLIIGIGDGRYQPDKQNILTFCRRLGINVEILNTEEACATFNYLNGEGRYVAAALIPPESISLFNPEFFLHDDDMSGMQGDVPLIERAHPEDPTHPRNWLQNPRGVLTDNALDMEMSRNRRKNVNKRDSAEMRYTEAKIKDEIDAMEDRYTPHGEKVVTDLEKEAKLELERHYLEYEKTGAISPLLELEMKYKDRPMTSVRDGPAAYEILEEYRTERWAGLDKSERFRKKFDKLYDVGQDDPPPAEAKKLEDGGGGEAARVKRLEASAEEEARTKEAEYARKNDEATKEKT